MITVVLGPDSDSAHTRVEGIVASVDPDRFSTLEVDGQTATTQEVINAVSTPPFFAEVRVTVVSSAFRGRSGGDAPDQEVTKKPGLDYQAIFGAMAPENHLVLLDASATTLPAAVRKLLPEGVEVFSGSPPRGQELLRWIVAEAAKAGGRLSLITAQELATWKYPRTWASLPRNIAFDDPPDLGNLRLEIEKLALYATNREITREDVQLLVAHSGDDSLFPLLDAFTAGQGKTFLREVFRLVESGEEAGKLLNALLQQAELAIPLAAQGAPQDATTIGSDLKLTNPARMAPVARAARGAATPVSRRAATALAVDRDLKTGHLAKPVDAVLGLLPRGEG